jgi:dihydrofolate reductase
MSKVQLFIAASLDGKIARPNGDVSWLEEYPNPDGQDYGYGAFYAGVGTVIMGRKTYEDILGFGVPWPYANARTYVVTSDEKLATPTPKTALLHGIDTATVREITKASAGNVWVVGGGKIISAFLSTDLVDELTLTVIPRVLGRGIPLFPEDTPETHLELKSAEAFSSGFVNLIYARKSA